MFKIPHQTGELQGARGARRALGDDRTRLHLQCRRRKAASLRRVAARRSPIRWFARSAPTSRRKLAQRGDAMTDYVAERAQSAGDRAGKPATPQFLHKASRITTWPNLIRCGACARRATATLRDWAGTRSGNARDMILRIIGYLFGIGAVFFLLIARCIAWYVSNLAGGPAGLRRPRQIRAAGDDAHPRGRRPARRRIRA